MGYAEELPYRVVVEPSNDRTTVTAATHGVDGVLNCMAGRLLGDAADGNLRRHDLDSDNASFVKASHRNGWLDDNLRLRGTFRQAAATPMIDRIQIETSLRCNLSCTYCYSESGPLRKDLMTASDVVDVVDQAERAGVSWIDLTGGEFLIFPGWREVLSETRRRGLVTTVHTNGMLLTERNVAFIKDVGVRTIQVSADSHLSDQHDSIRGVKGALDKLVRGIRTARDAGLSIRILLMAHRRNVDTFVDSVKWFHDELGIPVAADRVIAVGGAAHDPVALSTQEYYELLAQGLPSTVNLQRVCESPAGKSPMEVAPECGVGHSFLYVTADGRLSLCPTMTHRESPEFQGPTIFEYGVVEAWERAELFQRYRYVNCENATSRSCPAASVCGGGCRSNAYAETGRVTSPDFFACNSHKNSRSVFVDFGRRYADGHFEPVGLASAGTPG